MTDIFELASRTVDELVVLVPQIGTSLGIPGNDHRWADESPAGFDERRAFWQRVRDEATGCDTPTRSHEVAQAVLIADADQERRSIDAGLHLADLNNIASPWQMLRDTFDLMADDSPEAWHNIATRLATFGEPLTGYQQSLAAGLAAGRPVARRQVEVAIEQGRTAAGPASGFDLLLARLDSATTDHPELGDAALRAEVEEAIVLAKTAVGTMTDWLETHYLPAATTDDAVGRERYVAAAERFLGERIDPEAVYAWGWSEIAGLTARLETLAAQVDSTMSVAEVMHLLATDPSRGAPDMDSFIRTMQERQEAALAALDGSHFDVPEPVRQIRVKAAPPGGALSPYYSPPSEDFSRPGTVWYPPSSRSFFPLYEEVTTAYHEGFPGHHLQVGWQTAMGDELSRFHRLLTWYPGSGEGWALYAETLMGELGFLEKPDYEIGLITSQLFRSARIVIDIGTHCGLAIPSDQPFHPGESWTFDLATEMLRDVTFTPAEMAESEVVRYFGWPGQAISYKVGEKAILDLRAEMQAAPGFDLKQFHANVLSVGSIGLDLLRDLVRSA